MQDLVWAIVQPRLAGARIDRADLPANITNA
jgi:hypothetical protein